MRSVTAPSTTLEDVPFGGLPLRSERTVFDRNFIDLVALEVRWARPLAAVEQGAAIQIRDAIENTLGSVTLPVVERVEQRALTVELADGQASQQSVDVGHVLRTQDQMIAISVLPQSVGIQLNTYLRWSESMKPLIAAVLSGVTGTLDPGVVSRAGLRYVNRIHDTDCSDPKDWADGRISPALVAPYKDDWGLQQWVHVAREQIDFVLDDSSGARLQHGALTPTDYLIDIDIYNQRSQKLDVPEMVSLFTRMNRTAAALFQQSVPIEYMESRQPKGADQ